MQRRQRVALEWPSDSAPAGPGGYIFGSAYPVRNTLALSPAVVMGV
jgi:hypothetical protein